jgi:hypothetical protein
MKSVLAAIVGGLVVFVWSAVAHMALPIGTMGMSTLPDEQPVLDVLKEKVPAPGLYFVPAMDPKNKDPQYRAAWQAKYESGPSGLLIIHPNGMKAMTPRLLLTELLADVAAAWIVALVFAAMAAGDGRRMMIAALLGLFAWLSISVSYWNWYGYPLVYVTGEALDQIIGWALGGLAMAKLVKPSA